MSKQIVIDVMERTRKIGRPDKRWWNEEVDFNRMGIKNRGRLHRKPRFETDYSA
jgi:hypothetical protein